VCLFVLCFAMCTVYFYVLVRILAFLYRTGSGFGVCIPEMVSESLLTTQYVLILSLRRIRASFMSALDKRVISLDKDRALLDKPDYSGR
jgi:hypothetical protein